MIPTNAHLGNFSHLRWGMKVLIKTFLWTGLVFIAFAFIDMGVEMKTDHPLGELITASFAGATAFFAGAIAIKVTTTK